MIHPTRKDISNPELQPKVAQARKEVPRAEKKPCKFCRKVRAKVHKVAASWFNRGAK